MPEPDDISARSAPAGPAAGEDPDPAAEPQSDAAREQQPPPEADDEPHPARRPRPSADDESRAAQQPPPAADADPPAVQQPQPAAAASSGSRARLRRALRWGALPGALALGLSCWALLHARQPAATPAASSQPYAASPERSPEPAPPVRLHGERVLRGRVLDDRKLPLADAQLRVSSLDAPNALPWEAVSDKDGRFVLEGLVAHALSIEVTREGHDGTERVLRAEDAGELVFELARQGELLVVLRDTPGNAVEGALVTLTGPGLWPAAQLPASATGEVLFGKLAFGEYRARARRAGRIAQPSIKVRVVPGERSQLELTLEEGQELEARVIDRTTKRPIAGAQLALFDATPGVPPLLAESDADGAVRVRGLWPGELRIETAHAGHAPSSLDLKLPESGPLRIELDGEASIAGSVVDEQGKPIQGALLSVSTRDGLPVQLGVVQAASGAGQVGELGVTQGPVPRIPINASAQAALGTLASQSDALGGFRITGLAPAPIVLSAARSGYAAASLDVDDLVPHGERRGLRVVLHEAGSVEGQVRDLKGQPVAGVYVSAHAAGGAEQGAVTDAAGSFRLTDLLGSVTVEAAPQSGAPLSCRVQVAARSIARCDLTLAAAFHELSVRVVDDYGFGVESALVSVSSKTGGRGATQLSRRDGAALLRELPEPPYHVEATLRGFLPTVVDVSEIPKELRLSLKRAANLAGVVTDSLGRPVPEAFVSTDEGDASSETDAHGNFLLTGVAPGALSVWAVHASAGEGTSAEVRARGGQTLPSLRIVLSGRFTPGQQEVARDKRASSSVPPAEQATQRQPQRIKHSDFELEQRGGHIIIAEVVSAGSAERQGLRSGDTLLSVDGERVLSAPQALSMLRNPPGHAASLRVRRKGSELRLRYRRPEL